MLRRAVSRLAASAARGAPGRTFSSSSAHATTVLCVRKDGEVVLMADGQVTLGSQVVKPNVTKVRRLQPGVIEGFAGATADAFTLFERLEMKLEEHPGQLTRAAVELAKAWRNDKYPAEAGSDHGGRGRHAHVSNHGAATSSNPTTESSASGPGDPSPPPPPAR